MDIKGIEIFRSVIPANKLINDNSGQHYRILTGKSKWLTNKAVRAIEGEVGPGGFVTPSIQEVQSVIAGDQFSIIAEHWKCQRSFDLANYEMTFKSIIDVFSKMGYWTDDAWKYLSPFVFSGGDSTIWRERAIRKEADGLPDKLDKHWWIQEDAVPKTDSFIRIIACKKIELVVELS